MSIISTIPEQEEQPSLSVFLHDVLWGWSGLMTSGLIGIGFAIYPVVGGILTPILFILVGIVAVFIACYMLWRDERLKRFSIERELATEKEKTFSNQVAINKVTKELTEQTNTPQLEASIDEMAVAEFTEKGIKHSAVTLKICVSNLGMPSVAIDWLPVINVEGKQPLGFKYRDVSNELTLYYGESNENAQIIKGEDMIYQKTAKPIQTGDMIIGYLHFITTFTREELIAKNTDIKVFFKDVTRKLYEVTYDKNVSIQRMHPNHTPGVKTKTILVQKKQKQGRRKH